MENLIDIKLLNEVPMMIKNLISDITQIKEKMMIGEPSQPAKDFLTIDDVCEILQIGKQSLYKRTSNKQIPFFKVGKRLFFKKDDINNFISKGKTETQSEIIKKHFNK